MSTPLRPLVVMALACAGCIHAQVVDTGAGPEDRANESRPAANAEARAPAEPGRPELSTTPAGLMLDGGPLKIQQALEAKGYLAKGRATGVLDEETSGALRRFQEAEKLARTGAPDRETIRRLGLSVGEVFRRAPGS